MLFLSALMYTAVVLYHGDDYSEMVFRIVLVIIAELVIKNVMLMEVYGYLRLFLMLRGYAYTCVLTEQGQGKYRKLQR
jgi:hypothetical protein